MTEDEVKAIRDRARQAQSGHWVGVLTDSRELEAICNHALELQRQNERLVAFARSVPGPVDNMPDNPDWWFCQTCDGQSTRGRHKPDCLYVRAQSALAEAEYGSYETPPFILPTPDEERLMGGTGGTLSTTPVVSERERCGYCAGGGEIACSSTNYQTCPYCKGTGLAAIAEAEGGEAK